MYNLCSVLYFLLVFQTLLGWWNACGFLTSVAKQNSSNSLKFGLLVACLCGSFSLSFGSKISGRYISFRPQSKHIFNWHPHHRNRKRWHKDKRKHYYLNNSICTLSFNIISLVSQQNNTTVKAARNILVKCRLIPCLDAINRDFFLDKE